MQVEQKIKGVCVGRKVGKIKFVIQPDPPFGAQRFFEEKGILYYIDLDLQHCKILSILGVIHKRRQDLGS